MRRLLPILLPTLACLAACSSQPDDASGVTPDEDRQLNAAAASLDADTPSPVESPVP